MSTEAAFQAWVADLQSGGRPYWKVTNLRAAFEAGYSASGAEVTRLETGIAEALTDLSNNSADDERIWDAKLTLSRLSQPTTDTNGAHA